MCIDCGCGMDTVGSGMGAVDVTINDQTKQSDTGVTLNMTSTYEGMMSFGAGN